MSLEGGGRYKVTEEGYALAHWRLRSLQLGEGEQRWSPRGESALYWPVEWRSVLPRRQRDEGGHVLAADVLAWVPALDGCQPPIASRDDGVKYGEVPAL